MSGLAVYLYMYMYMYEKGESSRKRERRQKGAVVKRSIEERNMYSQYTNKQWFYVTHTKAEITFPRAERERLILIACLNCSPYNKKVKK